MPRVLFPLSANTTRYKIGGVLFTHDELEELGCYHFDALLVNAGKPSCQSCYFMRPSLRKKTLQCSEQQQSCQSARMTGGCGIDGGSFVDADDPDPYGLDGY